MFSASWWEVFTAHLAAILLGGLKLALVVLLVRYFLIRKKWVQKYIAGMIGEIYKQLMASPAMAFAQEPPPPPAATVRTAPIPTPGVGQDFAAGAELAATIPPAMGILISDYCAAMALLKTVVPRRDGEGNLLLVIPQEQEPIGSGLLDRWEQLRPFAHERLAELGVVGPAEGISERH